MSNYDDIIGIPRWNPKSHPRMSAYERAAQFAPFAALTGYEAMVSEAARLTDVKVELDEEQTLALNQALSTIMERLAEHPRVSVLHFRKDARKQGGAYQTLEGSVQNIDTAYRLLVMKEGEAISIDDIASITITDKPDQFI